MFLSCIYIIAGTTVKNKGKLILTEIFPSVQKHDIFSIDKLASQAKMYTKYLNVKTKLHKTIANIYFNTKQITN